MNHEPDTLTLKSLQIRDYRAIKQADIPLHPQLTVLIGENATGKTTTLDAIAVTLWPLIRKFATSARPWITVTASDFRAEPDSGFFGDQRRIPHLAVRLESSIGWIGSHYKLEERYADQPSVAGDHERKPIDWLSGMLESGETAPCWPIIAIIVASFIAGEKRSLGARCPAGRLPI
ncbi:MULTISPECIES: AAA family ATPase [unclassified Novosphingobium]|uniref:AAA family ATPase n=1 Tax=unclassified Novosphingobium TaxID=2644732 RepID=UPI000D3028B3|nr:MULTISPECIES: AAA family ATPase [unclassified Novosphingobium]PTR07635.1 AAA ATPase-like protein [Novosphingobium sp. GV055]PUB00337.1 AAA ATPase-like protein [Novosphingobium sp. GV061]PUB15378.1 AAA ATPase-like protein [Novosphingobium sp. GV079]PUB39254.1 AAA ATPase-like protein [Novosphingobium sp. GV027]